MKELDQIMDKLKEVQSKAKPWLDKADKGLKKARSIWKKAWPWIWQARKSLLAIPVVYLMLYFARLNWNVLPESVGLHLQVTGDYAQYITKQTAVYVPLGITGGCLAMMFLSRKTLYPWMICLFSMLLPLLILVTNIFPA